jgi:hypothetical protein
MTEARKLELLKSIYVGDKSDDTLNAYLALAASKVIARAYPFRSDIKAVPDEYAMNQVEIANYLLVKRGAEGETMHGENGITRTYESASVPESMYKGIIPYAGV